MPTLLGYCMIGAAIWAVWKKWSLARQVRAAGSWPWTEGEIVSSSISRERSGTYDHPNRVYRADVVYRYEVGGRRRQNDRICIGGQMKISMQGKSEDYVRRYPAGSEVTVYYNPRDPGDAVLEVREETSWFYLAIGAVVGVVGIAFATGVAP